MLRLALLWVGVILLTSCSRASFFYNQLDWLIPWYVQDLITLAPPQEQMLERKLQRQLQWHQTSQLPRYTAWLDAVSQNIDQGLTQAAVDQHTSELLSAWRDLIQQIAPDMIVLAKTLSKPQIAELFAALKQKDQELKAEYIDPPEQQQRRDRAERVKKQFKRWLGELTQNQQQLIDRWSQRYQPGTAAMLVYWGHWQRQLKQALSQQQAADFDKNLYELIVYPERLYTPALQQLRQNNRVLFQQLLIDIGGTLSSGQKQTLIKTLNSWARDFERLSQNAD